MGPALRLLFGSVSEFPDQSLTVSSGKLYCQACSTGLSEKKSAVSNYITTQRHKEELK